MQCNENNRDGVEYYARVRYTNTIVEECEVLVPVSNLTGYMAHEVLEACERAAENHKAVIIESPSDFKLQSTKITQKVAGFMPVNSNGEVLSEDYYEVS